MPAPLLKLIPTIVLVLTLAYLGWSHFDEEPPPAGPTGKLPEIAHELLRPEAPSATERDPFGKSIRFELGETSDERPVPGKKTGDKSPDKTVASLPRPGAAGNPPRPGSTAVQSPEAAAAAVKKLTPAEAAVVVERSMAELVLNATILSGEKRLAMINGHAYRPGEAIVASDPAAQLRVAEIHHHRVVLEREGKRVDLKYSDKSLAAKVGRPGQLAGPNNKLKTVKTGARTNLTRPPAAPKPRPPDASANSQTR